MIQNGKRKLMVATTKVIVRPERRKEFFQTIVPLTKRIRKEKGCVNYRLYEEMGDENSLILIMEWETESQWNDHRNGENFSVLLGLVTVLGMPAKTDFKLLSQIGGNELIGGH